jgi:hypothetical protein
VPTVTGFCHTVVGPTCEVCHTSRGLAGETVR